MAQLPAIPTVSCCMQEHSQSHGEKLQNIGYGFSRKKQGTHLSPNIKGFYYKKKKSKFYIKSSVLKSRSLIQSPLLLLIKFSSEIGILHLPSYRFRYITLQLFLLGLVWRLHIFCSLILLLFSIFNFWRVMNNGYHLEC